MRWYAGHRRDLPWRRRPAPYRVWISEVMLQQTVVAAVAARFEQWMARFADVPSLARASEQEVLAAWEGLGYYRRAQAARRAAMRMVELHGGRVPRAREALLALPGIGPCAAAAIRSIAFSEDEVALDANVMRVFMRLLGVEGSARDAAARRTVEGAARAALPSGRAGDYNQALMDFGSLICRPARPDCDRCFAEELCRARALGLERRIPHLRAKRLQRVRAAVAILLRGASVYVQRRPQRGRFAGMWEFPGGKLRRGETPRRALVREVREELGVACRAGRALDPIVHRYTVFEVTLHPFVCRPPARLPLDDTHRWVPLDELRAYPMPSANRRLVEALGRKAGRRP